MQTTEANTVRAHRGALSTWTVLLLDKLTGLFVPAYTRADLRFGWRLAENAELSVEGQHLQSPAHVEFVDPHADASTQDVQKAFVRMTCRS